MNYNTICKKLGFDPLKDQYPIKIPNNEDDSIQSPFSVLTLEESEFITDYLVKNS